MYRLTSASALFFLLASCAPPDRAQDVGTSSVLVIDQSLSALPMTSRARAEVVLALAQMASPQVNRACSPEERQFLEVSLILYTVGYEEWRTAPWTSAQRKEVQALRQRWQSLGGDARSVSDRCRAAVG